MLLPQAKKFRVLVVVFLITAVSSALWLGLSSFGLLSGLENMAMDMRFRFRGEVQSDLKIVYVDLDSQFISNYGEKPFNRSLFADVGRLALEEGEAKVMFYDFVFSPLTNTSLVSRNRLEEADNSLTALVYEHPTAVVMAATYSNAQAAYMEKAANLPLIHRGEYDKWNNPYPETPMFPIWNGAPLTEFRDGQALTMYPWGQVGLINVDYELSQGSVARYMAAFVEVSGETHALQTLTGLAHALGLSANPERVQERENSFVILDDAGNLLYSIGKDTDQTFLAAPLEILKAYHAQEGNPLKAEIGKNAIALRPLIKKEGLPDPLYSIPLVHDQLIEINWLRAWNTDTHYSMAEVLAWKERLDEAKARGDTRFIETETARLRNIFKDAIVLCGPVAPLLQDLAPTPYNKYPVPRVGIHGNMVDSIYQGLFIQRTENWLKWALVLISAFVAAGLGVYSGKFVFVIRCMIVLGIAFYALLIFNVFRSSHIVLPLVAPLGAALTSSLTALIYKTIAEERKRGRITGLFGTYVSPELVSQMVESEEEPKLGGETAEITAFFSDVQSFSSFSEVLTPEQLVELMNEYLDAMTVILQDAGGTLDKYIGDAVVAMFGAPIPLPDHALRACVATQHMQLRLAELRRKWKDEGEKWPPLVYNMQARIGLNTGPATVGNMGSWKRFNYTMMGDTVNLAARCESGAKSYGVYTMIAEQTKLEAERQGNDCVFRFLDRIQVKGRSQPASMYEIVCLRKHLSQEIEQCLEIYDKGIECYLRQDFAKASKLFSKSQKLEPNRIEKNPHAPTTPSEVMMRRCHYLMQEPPSQDWNGVFVMKTK